MARKTKAAVSWYRKGAKRPFATSTIAEKDSIVGLYWHCEDMRKIKSLYDNGDLLLNDNEAHIVNMYIEYGEYFPNIS